MEINVIVCFWNCVHPQPLARGKSLREYDGVHTSKQNLFVIRFQPANLWHLMSRCPWYHCLMVCFMSVCGPNAGGGQQSSAAPSICEAKPCLVTKSSFTWKRVLIQKTKTRCPWRDLVSHPFTSEQAYVTPPHTLRFILPSSQGKQLKHWEA